MVLSLQAVTLRRALLELHRAIIAEERAGYERRAGQVNAAAFLRVLIELSPDVAYAHGVVKQALRYATSAWQEPSRSPALPAS